jgi:proton glutamate symport protein
MNSIVEDSFVRRGFSALGGLLLNPVANFVSLGLAVVFGLFFPEWAKSFGAVGDVYIDLLKMIVLPFLLATITTSIARLFYEDRLTQYLGKVVVTIVGATLFASALGVLMALFFEPGKSLGEANMNTMGQLIKQASEQYSIDLEMELFAPFVEVKEPNTFKTLIGTLIPDNIFKALSSGESLKVLIFTIIFGTAIGSLPKRYGDGFLGSMQAIYFASQKIMRWMTVILPIALFAMVSKQIAEVGLEPVQAMAKYTISFSLAALLLLIVSVIILAKRANVSLFEAIKAIREPLLLAIGTRNSLACIPSINRSLVDDLKFEHNMVELVVPLAIALCRIGPAVFFAFSGVFVAQLYNVQLGVAEYSFIVGASVLAAFASTGTTGIVTITMLSLVCAPLGLPTEAVFALFVAVEPISDVLRTTCIVCGDCAVTAIICDKETEPEQVSPNLGVSQV